MSRRNRPSAFDVSFPEEVSSTSVPLHDEDNRSSTRSAPRSNASKRKEREDTADSLPSAVKRKLMVARPKDTRKDGPKTQYFPENSDLYETENTTVMGEDPDDAGGDGLPVRVLSDFCVFDPKDNYRLYSLDDANVYKRKLEAAGSVSPVYANEEDEGQEDDVEGSLQRLRTTRIEQYSLDYESRDDPLYILTKHAWYQLRYSSDAYLPYHLEFYRPHRVTQVLVSMAKENRNLRWDELIDSTTRIKDPLLGVRLDAEDFLAVIPLISVVLSEIENGERLRSVPAIRRLLDGSVPLPGLSTHAPPAQFKRRPHTKERLTQQKNIDLAVLRPEHQNPTHVTPLIDQLARGWFNERLHVVGVKLPEDRRESEEKYARLWMLQCLDDYIKRQMKKDRSKKKHLDSYAAEDRLVDQYWKAVDVDGVKYSVGDTILTPRGNYEPRKERAAEMPRTLTNIPLDAIISDFFWFGRIVHIDQQHRKLHLQWFDHAPRSILEELSDPRELFLWNSCGEIDADNAYGRVKVKFNSHSQPHGAYVDTHTKPSTFYCNYLCDEATASFTSVPSEYTTAFESPLPPDNCPSCLLFSQQEQDRTTTPVRDGAAYGGHTYHKQDFVLYSNKDSGPASIAQIVRFVPSRGRERALESAVLRIFGRISDVISICPSGDIIKDERHLFMTEEETQVPIEALVAPCFVVTDHAMNDDSQRQDWLFAAPNRFYVRYQFPTAKPTRWADRTRVTCEDLRVCVECFKEETARASVFRTFIESQKRRPLRSFDPFGGVGAFSLGIEESGCMKLCQAIEISPSAAEALRKNSPQTIVHNQCSNIVLEYAIKSIEGHRPEVPRELGRSHRQLPAPPRPGDVDVVVAGFPCQPHSRLNMFQHANDRKSHLILNLLSWIDFLRPRYCVFENVRGFLRYNLHAYQAGRHQVEGGIEMGGMKFLVRALLAMRYQVRFGLLQAGHYGTPQSRVRFFLVAAVDGCTLPSLPQPTHDFPVVDALEMKFSNEAKAQPICTTRGFAPHHFVSVDDAIGDLRRFHWKHPSKKHSQHGDVLELSCDHSKPYCGFSGPEVPYECPPKTTFQEKCRRDPSADLQHFTKVPPAATVERVVNIPLSAKADYRNLKPELWEWQFSNPSSAVARQGFKPGLYGRLNKDGWFNTTVTNVEPTAKQSWVLNPYCKRMVTVRELARSQGFPDSFIFHSENGDVKTLHRQIGNAVPWPVAAAIGHKLLEAVFTKWTHDRHMAEPVETEEPSYDL